MGDKLRALGIVPYVGMKLLMEQVVKKRDDIDLVAYVGDLENGAEIAAKYTAADFDVIISRGGTAEILRSRSSLPIVDIPLSLYDILRSVKLAGNSGKLAIVGFPAITQSARFLCDVLRYDLTISTIHNEAEAEAALKELAAAGCNLVLCDMITNSLAQKQGIPAILITSGTESIESAFDQAIQTRQTYRKLLDQISFYKSLLDDERHAVYAFGDGGRAVFASNSFTVPPPVIEKMEGSVECVTKNKEKTLSVEIDGTQYLLSGSCRDINDAPYVVYGVDARKTPLTLSKNGIAYSNKEEAYDEFFNSFYGITQSTSAMGLTIGRCLEGQQPLMILGEEGTGKGQMLRLVYAKSAWSNNPLITIDCSRLHERGWKFLLEHESSPLCDSGNSIYFRHIEGLPEPQFQELVAEIDNTNCCRNNKVYFVHAIRTKEDMSARSLFLVNHFSCATIKMPPLRSHKEDIPNLASIYISILNMELVKEVIGFEPEALQMLKALDWPSNYDQFKRIVHELVVVTDTPYIQGDTVKKLLRSEEDLFCSSRAEGGTPLDLSLTLEEIDFNILKAVLAEERGNQKAAAERLGISRTTLWRMMQKLGV
jgi:Response regulator containing CheY-like receiver, AAA-type ATPase, and DNA-binding domains